ncbi:MAG: PaaI family thioesterase [Rhabdochlamydiaceae bacterium]|jgi:1,4-dihydroxy-2-naphthoyl-CoA hydrolase
MKSIWKSHLTLEDLQKRCENSLVDHLGIVFTEKGENYLVAEMPIESHHKQYTNILHGGASAVLAETVASAAAYCAVDPKTHTCVGLDLNINHLKPVHSGKLTAKTFPNHIGKTTQVWTIEIRDGEDRLIAISRLTVANLELKK